MWRKLKAWWWNSGRVAALEEKLQLCELRSSLRVVAARNATTAIKGALLISDLWMPPDDGTLDGDVRGEYAALCRMHDSFEAALKSAKDMQ